MDRTSKEVIQLANTTPRSVRVLTSDLERIHQLYAIPGIHGRVTKMCMDGVHLLTFIEEVERGRADVNGAVREAIHTLRSALDRRDSRENAEGKIEASSNATIEA